MKFAIDAFGGDNAPEAVIRGSIDAMQLNDDFSIIFTGDESAIYALLNNYEYDKSRVEVVHGDHVQDVCICNTEGVFVTDRRVQTRLRVSAIASNGTENQSGSDAPGASMGFELFDTRVNAEESGKIAAQQAVTMLHAPVCPAGVMPVAIDNGFGGLD